jgi:hypothetical protein
VTVNIDPVTGEIPIAAVCALGPAFATAGAKLTVTLLEELVPVGNPAPVTRISCTPGWPALGEAEELKVTWARVVDAVSRRNSGTMLSNRRILTPGATRGKVAPRSRIPVLGLTMRSPIPYRCVSVNPGSSLRTKLATALLPGIRHFGGANHGVRCERNSMTAIRIRDGLSSQSYRINGGCESHLNRPVQTREFPQKSVTDFTSPARTERRCNIIFKK